jgi:multiple antibiotic resistance protein
MLDLIQTIPFSFAALFPVLNPIGSSVIILALVKGSPSSELNKLAYKIALYTAIMLIVVLFSGSWILQLFGITIPIVLIGGGLVLSYIGWQLLIQPATPKKDPAVTNDLSANLDKMTFYPLTMPITAGPGCIAVVIALGAHSVRPELRDTLSNQIGNSIGILLVALTVYFCYRYTHVIADKLGESGTAVIMRMAAFFNVCIGLELIWHGLVYLLKLQ